VTRTAHNNMYVQFKFDLIILKENLNCTYTNVVRNTFWTNRCLVKGKYFILIVLIIFSSCQNKQNISVSGKITNESGEPIQNAEVVVLCWYMHSLDDASFEKQTVTTDKDGNYIVKFVKGYQIDVASKTRGYLPNRSYNELKNNELQVNLTLSKTKSNPTLLAILNTDINSFEETDKVPSIRVRIYSKTGNVLDLDNIETYGFDLKTLSTNSDTTKCDFWFKIERKEIQPSIIRTNLHGGIIPVYTEDINSTFLFEKATAPTIGYRQQYTLKGNEEGFFILARDGKTFGKLVLEKSIIDRGSPVGKERYYKEYIRQFTCLYQPNGTTDLSYSESDIDLEDFLVDHRLQ
jgi:hypothetical protein